MSRRYPEVPFDGIIWDNERKTRFMCVCAALLNVVEWDTLWLVVRIICKVMIIIGKYIRTGSKNYAHNSSFIL